MSTRRNNSSRASCVVQAIFVIVFLAVVVMIVRQSGERSRRQPHRTTGVHTPASAPQAAPARSPIEPMLAVPPGIPRVEGAGLAILVDVSGSMSQSVRDVGDASRPKIEIARRAIGDVVRTAEAHYRKLPPAPAGQPDKRLLVGLYEFSARPNQAECRPLLPLQPPNAAAAEAALARMAPSGGTPIGNAVIRAKRDLDASGLTRLHLLVVTDGENNQGYSPEDVINAIGRLDEAHRASVYFIAFDVAAEKFRAVREAGGLVLAASGGQELQQTLDYVLTGKVLVEQPSAPGSPP